MTQRLLFNYASVLEVVFIFKFRAKFRVPFSSKQLSCGQFRPYIYYIFILSGFVFYN